LSFLICFKRCISWAESGMAVKFVVAEANCVATISDEHVILALVVEIYNVP
jgi:hypothetical protein